MLYFFYRSKKLGFMDYKKKSLNKLNKKESYEEIDTRLASGWYVDTVDNVRKKKYKLFSQILINLLYKFKKWHKLFRNVAVNT